MTSKSSTASSQNKLSNSAAKVAPPNHVQNVDTARVPSDCEDNAIKAQLSHVDGENVIGLFDGPDVEFDPIPSSGPFDQEGDDDGGGKATPEPHPNTIAAPTRAVSRQHNYATGAVSAEGYVSTTAPNLNKNAAAAIIKKNSPKPKKCAATDWSIEIKSHEDVMRGWLQLMGSGWQAICNICRGIPLQMRRQYDEGNLLIHCEGISHCAAKQSKLNHQRSIDQGKDK